MNGQLQYNRGLTEPRLPRSALAVRVTAVMLLCFLGWAWYFQLDEVTTGSGTVEPSGREQVVQSLEGGILYHLDVKVGDIVEQGQPLAQLNRTKTESDVQEAMSRLYAALATSARLRAEVSNKIECRRLPQHIPRSKAVWGSLIFPDRIQWWQVQPVPFWTGPVLSQLPHQESQHQSWSRSRTLLCKR